MALGDLACDVRGGKEGQKKNKRKKLIGQLIIDHGPWEGNGEGEAGRDGHGKERTQWDGGWTKTDRRIDDCRTILFAPLLAPSLLPSPLFPSPWTTYS